MSDDLDELSRLGQELQPECYRSDVDRVRDALYAPSAGVSVTHATILAPRVLAAIRAAATNAFYDGACAEASRGADSDDLMHAKDSALDAALAALTDHPGGEG